MFKFLTLQSARYSHVQVLCMLHPRRILRAFELFEFCSQGLDLQVRLRKSIYTGLCDIFFVSLVIYIQIPSEIFSLQGLFVAFVSLKILVVLITLNLSSAALKETAPQLSPASCNAQAQSLVAQKVIYSVPRSTAHLRSGWLRT